MAGQREPLAVYLTAIGLMVLSGSSFSQEGYILKAGQGEVLGDGFVVKASPLTGTVSSILVEQTFQRGSRTSLHAHDQGDELFYVVSGHGTARLGGTTGAIESGDVLFVPKGHPHAISNLNNDQPLKVIFFMDSPELIDRFRAIHEGVTSEPDRPVTLEERAAIYERIGGSRRVVE
jgi:mannose-6-phosphate isomerase-like protein (cupin superfamily)